MPCGQVRQSLSHSLRDLGAQRVAPVPTARALVIAPPNAADAGGSPALLPFFPQPVKGSLRQGPCNAVHISLPPRLKLPGHWVNSFFRCSSFIANCDSFPLLPTGSLRRFHLHEPSIQTASHLGLLHTHPAGAQAGTSHRQPQHWRTASQAVQPCRLSCCQTAQGREL